VKGWYEVGSKVKKHQERKPRNWVCRQMILERIGVNAAAPMDRTERRQKDFKKSWKSEDWGEG